jgi:hypothetical protein
VVGQQIVGFGIKLRIGQILVIVMGQMQLAIAPIGKPEAGIDRYREFVDEAVAGRMAMQRLMLE